MRLLFMLFCLFTVYHKLVCPPAEAVRPIAEQGFETEPEKQDTGQKAPSEQIPPTGMTPPGETTIPGGEPTSTIPVSSLPSQSTVTLQPSTTTQAPSQETGTIAVKTTPTESTAPETIPTKEQTLSDWQNQWKSLSGGWFSKGELAKTSPEQRAQKILDFIQAVPTAFFDNPETAIQSLSSVLSAAKSTLKGAPQEQADLPLSF